MIRLIVNNEDLDLYENTDITLNMSIAKIADISTRNSTYTNTISLPPTSKNKRLFEFAGVMGNQSRFPYKKVPCTYMDGNVVICQGYLFLLETNGDYKVSLFDGILNISETLGDKTLRDLNYSDLNHYFTKANFESSWTNTNGYIYGIANFGNSPVDRGYVQIANQAPSIYAHTLWNKIFSESNINYRGDFFTNNTDWKNYVVTPSIGNSPTATEVTETNFGTVNTFSYPTAQTIFESNEGSDWFMYEVVKLFGSFSGGNTLTPSTGTVTVNFTGLAKINLKIDYRNRITDVMKVILNKNNVPLQTWTLEGGWDNGEDNTDRLLEEQIQLQVSTGDKFTIDIYLNAHDVGSRIWTIKADYNCQFTLSQLSTTGNSYFVNFRELISDTGQAEFVKDMMQRYGLIAFQSSENRNTFEFREIGKLLSDRENAVDYTDKVVSIGGEKYTSGYAQKNIASYNYPSDITERLYDGQLMVDNETSIPSKELFKSIFEIPNRDQTAFRGAFQGGFKLYQVPIWSDKNDTNNIAQETKESKLKYMYVETSHRNYKYKYFLEPEYDKAVLTPVLSLTTTGYNYFLTRYYKEFRWLLEDYKELEVELKLTPLELGNIDFFKLVYLKQTGRYYYLDSIKGGRKCKAKLIEISRFN